MLKKLLPKLEEIPYLLLGLFILFSALSIMWIKNAIFIINYNTDPDFVINFASAIDLILIIFGFTTAIFIVEYNKKREALKQKRLVLQIKENSPYLSIDDLI
ncbi:MAG: hypothetical protein HeimC3_05490 [Candidatus Heimdallarchaeota archaeon LC_3]|nr:MAG: hypothetical protein HeimC3_05490 [Candidatus Heimdallarchaeota archaeon LC_3]